MDLFNQEKISNLLPFDGTVKYYGKVFTTAQANSYFDILFNTIDWKHDEANMFGRHIITKRKVAWYGESNYHYTYSNATKLALPWTKELVTLKQISENHSGSRYNSCLLNLYHDGNEGMAWHSDDEKMLAKDSSIASLTFGAERNFAFKHKTKAEKVSLILEHGSLLEMKGTTQQYWHHRLPPTKKVTRPRINLTFRTMDIPV